MAKSAPSPLDDVPDLADWDALAALLDARLGRLATLRPDDHLLATLCVVEGDDRGAVTSLLGRYGSIAWRKLAVATLLADWACYRRPVDRVGLARLAQVMHAFPRGFRTFFARAPDGGWLPVGYSGWFPIPEESFNLLEAGAPALADRQRVVPLGAPDGGASFLYLFNYSVLPQLRGTACARRLVKELAAAIAAVPRRGLAAIAVSPDGRRVAERFGLRHAASLFIDGTEEWIYTARAGAPPTAPPS